MQFRIEQRFGLPVDAVEDALSDPGFIQASTGLPKLGHTELLARHVDADTVHTQVRYQFTGELSRAVRRVVNPARLTWVNDATTDRHSHRTVFRIVPDNYHELLRASGEYTISSAPGGSVRLATGTVDVSVPLVGGKVERAIISGLEEHARAEQDLLAAWVSGKGGSPS